MSDDLVLELQRLYPQIYLACHVDHVRAASTEYQLSSHDGSILAHLDSETGTSPRDLARHLGVVPSTLSASLKRLEKLGYITSAVHSSDRRRKLLRLTTPGARAMASTSVLDADRIRSLLLRLSASEQRDAIAGLSLLARAAREMRTNNDGDE
jgi:MarR family transcriptional regulator, organic hydroperoxide resistance regulator